MTEAHRSADTKACGHTPLYAHHQTRWAERVTPCPYCQIEELRAQLKQAQHRSFQDGRISYKGFGYGVGSQWGIDSLRRAIEGNGHG